MRFFVRYNIMSMRWEVLREDHFPVAELVSTHDGEESATKAMLAAQKGAAP